MLSKLACGYTPTTKPKIFTFVFIMHLSMSSRRGRRGGGAQGGDLIDRFGPGVGHLNHLAVLGVGIFEVLFVPVTTNHFPGWGISVIFDLTFLPGEIDSNFLENVKSPPYAPPPPPPPGRLGIDRCISLELCYVCSFEHTLNRIHCGIISERKGERIR